MFKDFNLTFNVGYLSLSPNSEFFESNTSFRVDELVNSNSFNTMYFGIGIGVNDRFFRNSQLTRPWKRSIFSSSRLAVSLQHRAIQSTVFYPIQLYCNSIVSKVIKQQCLVWWLLPSVQSNNPMTMEFWWKVKPSF